MSPFEFVLLFISFIYSLALGHLLMGVARMIRHRRELKFSWPHALWMAAALLSLMLNWLSFWDFHARHKFDIAEYLVAALICVANYLVAALATPEFETPEDYDLHRFHERQRAAYVGAMLVLTLLALGVNLAAALEGVPWARQNGVVLAMAAPPAAALVFRNRLVQAAAPAVECALLIGFVVAYYPGLA